MVVPFSRNDGRGREAVRKEAKFSKIEMFRIPPSFTSIKKVWNSYPSRLSNCQSSRCDLLFVQSFLFDSVRYQSSIFEHTRSLFLSLYSCHGHPRRNTRYQLVLEVYLVNYSLCFVLRCTTLPQYLSISIFLNLLNYCSPRFSIPCYQHDIYGL